MQRETTRVGQEVFFGRPNGEQTRGVVKKCNPKSAKVETLESRGSGRVRPAGQVWKVPYSLMTPADGTPDVECVVPVPEPIGLKLKYSKWQTGAEVHILDAILDTFGSLSPENLACDGEASMTYVRTRGAELRSRLRALFSALGRPVTESEIYEWDNQRREAEKVAV